MKGSLGNSLQTQWSKFGLFNTTLSETDWILNIRPPELAAYTPRLATAIIIWPKRNPTCPAANKLNNIWHFEKNYIYEYDVKMNSSDAQNINVHTHRMKNAWHGIKQISGLVQERRNSSAFAMELHLSCTNSSKWCMSCVLKSDEFQGTTANINKKYKQCRLLQNDQLTFLDTQKQQKMYELRVLLSWCNWVPRHSLSIIINSTRDVKFLTCDIIQAS